MRGLGPVIGLVALAGVVGCGMGKEKAAAEQVAGDYFECVKQKDLEGTLDFYSPKFYQATSREKWLELQKKINAKLGDLQDYKLAGWNWRKHAGTGSGSYVQLRYETTYAKYPAQEALVLYKPLRGGEFKILSHNINSEGLLME